MVIISVCGVLHNMERRSERKEAVVAGRKGVLFSALLVVLGAACSGISDKPVVFPPDGVHLEYRPGVPVPKQVYVSGTFNQWKMFDPAFRMTWNPAKKVFAIKFSLPAAEYMYKFIVDGEWVVDPGAARTVDDKLGGKMGVFVVAVPK